MNLEVLISSMNISSMQELPHSFNWLKKKQIPLVLINQCTQIAPDLNIDEENILVISENKSGLSKSRNKAIKNAKKEICQISDDDLKYVSDFKFIIEDAHLKHPNIDIIVFQIQTNSSKKYKNYGKNIKRMKLMDLAKVSSVEISFKRKSILSNSIEFDENFGLGATFQTGEEFIFLSDAYKKGLKILYVPKPIVIHPIESSGKDFENKNLIEAKGAMFFRVFGLLGYIYSFLFSLMKCNISNFNFFSFFKNMLIGIKKFKQLNS